MSQRFTDGGDSWWGHRAKLPAQIQQTPPLTNLVPGKKNISPRSSRRRAEGHHRRAVSPCLWRHRLQLAPGLESSGKILGRLVRGGGGGPQKGGGKVILGGMLNHVLAVEGAVCGAVGVMLLMFPDNLRDSLCNRTVLSPPG